MRFILYFIILVAILAAAVSQPTATANEREHKVKYWMKWQDKRPSRSLCYIGTPWPFKCMTCPDADGDGICDRDDKCPDTPCCAKVGPDGCPFDSDGDGIYDGIDKCPDTPKGAKVNEKGCPLDSDKDGVCDGIDQCPDTPRDAKVDKHGCPIKTSETALVFLDTGVFTTSEIVFEFDSAEIKPESYKILNEIGDALSEWPELEIEIGGHTDNKGSEDYNQKLSEKRAQAVLDYLTKNFSDIRHGNYSVKGYGEKKSVASNDSEEGRAENRRVEFIVLNKEKLKHEVEHEAYEKK